MYATGRNDCKVIGRSVGDGKKNCGESTIEKKSADRSQKAGVMSVGGSARRVRSLIKQEAPKQKREENKPSFLHRRKTYVLMKESTTEGEVLSPGTMTR